MHRYVGVLLALLAVNSNRVFAAGNIGCLFSDTLCEQEREWCFDDHAFGHCLPHYGHYREEDLHRYELGSDELRLLEQEMQRLFLLGYRWSHTYTQCVLQELLHAIRRKADFDISSCNGDVDQDLEGALRAIEGEELEQVDPRDLAIVRFTPSATDPHSDYADEVYFPPIKDQLLEGDHSSDDQQDDDDDDQADAGDHQESPTSEPGESTGRADGSSAEGSPHHQQGGGVNTLPANPPGPPMNDAASAPTSPNARPPSNDPRQQNYIRVYGPNNDMDDYDDSSTYRSPYHYQTPMNPVYRKRSRPEDEVAFQGGGGQITISQLRRIASLLDNLSGPKPVLTDAQERMLFPDGLQTDDLDDQEDLDEGVFGESPTRPMYSEAGLQFIPEVEDDGDMMESAAREAILSNLPQDLHVVPEGLRSMPDEFRNLPGVLDTLSPGGGRNYENAFRNLPEAMRNLPGGLDILPGGYGPAPSAPQEYLSPEPLPVENSIPRSFYMPDSNPFEVEKENLPWEGLMLQEEEENSPYQKSPPRSNNKITALQEAFGPQLNSIRDFEDDYNDYPDYGELLDEYGEYGQYDAAPGLLLPDRAFPFLQKFDKKDEERAGGDYDDMVQPGARSFLRPERLDVKKPGPGYEVNNYAFDEYASGRDRLGEVGLLLPKLLSEDRGPPVPQDIDDEANMEEQRDMENLLMGIPSQQTREQLYPDLLLADESFVDEATDDEDISGPRAEKWEDKKEEAVEMSSSTSAPTETPTSLVKGPDSYVHIYISGTFKTRKDGDDLAKVVVKLAGLTQDYIDNIDVDTDRVSFKVKENRRGITARDVAKKAGELQGQVESETGQTISEARVGDVNDTVRLMERFVASTAVSEMVFSSSEKHILAAAAIVCGVMAALLVAASVLFFLRRHAKSKAKLLGLTAHDTEASKDYQDLCRARMAGKAGEGGKVEPPTSHVPSQRISSLSKDSDNGNNSPSSRSSTSSWSEEPVASNMDISTGHMVLSYMEDHLKNKDRLEQEWIALCAYEAEPCATTLAMKPENKKKNRYPDSVPYDHNRVILNAHANVNGSDYINASSIQTDHDPRNPAYIATQGPLDTTAADFWQLVWEQGSVVIVMLTRLTENGLAFCHRYWPEEGSDLYHIYEVHLVSEHIWCDDYLVRSFYLKNVKTGETRTVTQFHFLSWPDSGTPASTKALLEFRRKVNKSYRGRSCPIIVHCSNGIGRTGTYSLIDMVLNRMAKGAKEIDIAATLEHIRDQRPQMVKSKAQFEFVLMAVAEEVHAILKALPQ